MTTRPLTAWTPATRVGGRAPYASPAPPYPIDLWLNRNEGPPLPRAIIEQVWPRVPERIRRYPDPAQLERFLATRHGVDAEQVLVTAGADDALQRVCSAVLESGREVVLPTPTFEMLDRYARLAGAEVVEVDWLRGSYPTEQVIGRVTERTALVAVVSPNNPTGSLARPEDLHRLSAALPYGVLLVDLAYGAYAEEDLGETALALPNAVVVHSLSKAWGLAGLRVGYAVGSPDVLAWMRCVGNPYAVSGVSLALAEACLRSEADFYEEYIRSVRRERAALSLELLALGADPLPSQGNFVLARFPDAARTWDELGRRGIAVRSFPGHPILGGYLRITCPGDPADFERLSTALRQST